MADFYVYRFTGGDIFSKLQGSTGLTPDAMGALMPIEVAFRFPAPLSANDQQQLSNFLDGRGFIFKRHTTNEFALRASFSPAPAEIVIPAPAATWAFVGGATMNPEFLTNNVTKAKLSVWASVKTTGAGGEIRLVQRAAGGVETVLGSVSLPGTGGNYGTGSFLSTVDPSAGDNEYRLEARLNTATALSIRCASLYLIETL